MASFDIVSKVDLMEVQNAVNQAKKELTTRFDFKGSNASIDLDGTQIKLSAEDQFKMKALVEIVVGKLAKRGISLKNVDKGEPQVSPLGHTRQEMKIKQGIEGPVAKDISKYIRDQKLKLTAQIQGDELRVSGKNKDDLQTVINTVKEKDWPVSLSFINFRD